MHLDLAGLLHFVRNDGKGVVNYGSINNVVLQERRSGSCMGFGTPLWSFQGEVYALSN